MKTKILIVIGLNLVFTANSQVLTVTGNTFGTLAPLTVTYSGASGIGASWIGLYRADSPDGDYMTYQYINESVEGSLIFPGREETGLFNFRLFRGGGYDKIGTSANFMIRQGMLADQTFHDGGVYRKESIGGFPEIWATAIRVLPNDMFVVAGNIRTGQTDPTGYVKNAFMAARFLANGTPDPDFGDNGFAYATFSDLYYSAFNVSAIEAKAMVVQSDGKVIVGGNGMIYGAGFYIQAVIMVRFNSNGTIDNTFGTNGVVIDNYKWPTEGNTFAWDDLHCLELDYQGRILAGGGSLLDRPYSPGRPFIGRYLQDGTSDSSFGGLGMLTPGDSIAFRGYVESIVPSAADGDGSILAGITQVSQFAQNYTVLYRIAVNGNFVQDFGHKGIVVDHRPGMANDQYLISTGISSSGNLILMGRNNYWSMWLSAKNPADGSDISAFGDKGVTVFDPTYSVDVPAGMVLTADNRIVVGTSTMSYRWSVARFEPNGSLRSDFGVSFHMLMENGSNVESFVSGIGMQKNGKYILVGGSRFPSTYSWDFMVLRFADNPETLAGTGVTQALTSRLSQNFPNPFTQSTSIGWSQASDSHVSLIIFDVLGNQVAQPVNENRPAGYHQLTFNSDSQFHLQTGNYFYQIRITPLGSTTGVYTETRKMTVLPGTR